MFPSCSVCFFLLQMRRQGAAFWYRSHYHQLYVRTLYFDRIQTMILHFCDFLWTESVLSGLMHLYYLWIISMKNVGKTRCRADEVSEFLEHM